MRKTILAFGLALLAALAIVSEEPVSAAPQYPPTILYSTLLNEVKIHHNTGNFRIGTMTGLFFPPPVRKSKMIYTYNPKDGGKLDAALRKGDGTLIGTFNFYSQPQKAPYWIVNSNELDGKPSHDFKLTQPGDYTLEFMIEGKPFLKFPFSVATVQSDDPYNPQTLYFLEGDWNNWGYLYYPNARPSSNLHFKAWLHHKGRLKNHDVKNAMAELVDSSGKVLGASQVGLNLSLRPEWIRYDFLLRTDKGALVAQDLIGKDGSYAIRLKMDGKEYGRYPFMVRGGKIVTAGRADRAGTDPLNFIEGGPDAFWVKKL